MCSEHFGMQTISWGKRWRGGSGKCRTGALMLPGAAAAAAAAAWTCTSGRLSLGDKETQVCCPACRTWSGDCRITPHLTPKQSREGEGCGRGKGFGRWGCIFSGLYTYLVQTRLAFVRFVQVWKPLWSFPVILSEGCWVCYEIHPDRTPFRRNSFSHLKTCLSEPQR